MPEASNNSNDVEASSCMSPPSCTSRDVEQQDASSNFLTPKEFLSHFRSQVSEHIGNAYNPVRSLRESNRDGSLTLSLVEDISYLLEIQIQVLDEYLSLMSTELEDNTKAVVQDVCIDAVFSILHALFCRQIHSRDKLLGTTQDIETCCAAANDFLSLAEMIEEWAVNMTERYPHLCLVSKAPIEADVPEKSSIKEEFDGSYATNQYPREVPDLVQLYSRDAVYAVQIASMCSIRDIEDAGIEGALFSIEWEDRLVNNEVARSLVRILEDCVEDLEQYLRDNILRKKAMDALVTVVVVFYIRCLIWKAKHVRQWRKQQGSQSKKLHKIAAKHLNNDIDIYCRPFFDPPSAVRRIKDDVYILKNFFKTFILQMPALDRVIEEEFVVLEAVISCFEDAVGLVEDDSGTPPAYLGIVYKGMGFNSYVTHKFISDMICMTVSNKDLRRALIDCIERNMLLVKKESHISDVGEKTRHTQSQRCRIPNLGLESMLVQEYCMGQEAQTKSPYRVFPKPKEFSPESIKKGLSKSRRRLHKLGTQPKQTTKRFLKNCNKAGMLN